MAADFEEEGRLATETVTRAASNPATGLAALAFVVVAAVLALYFYTSSRNRQTRVQSAQEETFATARLQPGLIPDRVVAKPDDNKFVIPPPPPTPPEVAQVPIVPAAAPTVPTIDPMPTRSIVDDGEAKRLAEAEARREARLRSPMLVVNDHDATASIDPSRVSALREEEDGNRRFLANAEQGVTVQRATKNRRIDALVPQGFMIRGILETAINSDLPGNVRATTTEDVYSFDGRRVLIPKGTMLTGEYRSGLSRGQSRVFIAWTRMLRSDGVSMMLGSTGTDGLGRSGLTGDVDTHFLQRFGNAALLTVTGGVAQFVAGLGQRNTASQTQYAFDPLTGSLVPVSGGNFNATLLSARQIGAQSAASGISKMAEEALRDEIRIPPTINIDQGTRIIVFVKRDLDFSDFYPDPVKEALYELKHPGRRARSDADPALGDAAGFLPPGGGAYPGLVAKP